MTGSKTGTFKTFATETWNLIWKKKKSLFCVISWAKTEKTDFRTEFFEKLIGTKTVNWNQNANLKKKMYIWNLSGIGEIKNVPVPG